MQWAGHVFHQCLGWSFTAAECCMLSLEVLIKALIAIMMTVACPLWVLG